MFLIQRLEGSCSICLKKSHFVQRKSHHLKENWCFHPTQAEVWVFYTIQLKKQPCLTSWKPQSNLNTVWTRLPTLPPSTHSQKESFQGDPLFIRLGIVPVTGNRSLLNVRRCTGVFMKLTRAANAPKLSVWHLLPWNSCCLQDLAEIVSPSHSSMTPVKQEKKSRLFLCPEQGWSSQAAVMDEPEQRVRDALMSHARKMDGPRRIATLLPCGRSSFIPVWGAKEVTWILAETSLRSAFFPNFIQLRGHLSTMTFKMLRLAD